MSGNASNIKFQDAAPPVDEENGKADENREEVREDVREDVPMIVSADRKHGPMPVSEWAEYERKNGL
jgi:hypothetical protein